MSDPVAEKVEHLDSKLDSLTLDVRLLAQSVAALSTAVGTFVTKAVYDAEQATLLAKMAAVEAKAESAAYWLRVVGAAFVTAIVGALVLVIRSSGA